MRYSIVVAAALFVLALSACERDKTDGGGYTFGPFDRRGRACSRTCRTCRSTRSDWYVCPKR